MATATNIVECIGNRWHLVYSDKVIALEEAVIVSRLRYFSVLDFNSIGVSWSKNLSRNVKCVTDMTTSVKEQG
jgi:hypothetical protein